MSVRSKERACKDSRNERRRGARDGYRRAREVVRDGALEGLEWESRGRAGKMPHKIDVTSVRHAAAPECRRLVTERVQ